MIIEVCVTDLVSARLAQEAGADRIEVCTSLELGGLTPSYGLLQQLKKHISIPIHVLLRPRAGDFMYSEEELKVIELDLIFCKELGVAGVVLGALQPDATIDLDVIKKLKELANGMHVTFHRAFDWVPNPMTALQDLERLGITTILSSGQQATAEKGISLLKEMNALATKTQVMPGAGISPNNVSLFIENGFKSIHFSGTELLTSTKYSDKLPMIANRNIGEGKRLLLSKEKLTTLINTVK